MIVPKTQGNSNKHFRNQVFPDLPDGFVSMS